MAAPPLLLGHRGARATRSVAENTMESFELALSHGCDGFEFDVRRSAEGHAVVCHDPAVNKLKVCDVSSSQLPQCPLLIDVLKLCAHRAFLDIELKVPELEVCLLDLLREYRPQREYVVSSFLPEVVMELKARSASVPVGIICDRASQLVRWRDLPVDYVIAEQHLVSQTLVNEIHAAGRLALVWTVNDAKKMMQFAEWNVDGIISDETELMVRTFKGSKKFVARQ